MVRRGGPERAEILTRPSGVASMIPADLLELLRCPLSGQTLAFADESVIMHANSRRPQADRPITAALVCADQRFVYPVRDGIPVLLAEEAITL